MSNPHRISIVVPCFNEEDRLPVIEFQKFASDNTDIVFFMVNDGSTDKTLDLLKTLEKENPAQFTIIDLDKNYGKATAVQHGMLKACTSDVLYLGYMDADLATPLSESIRLCNILDNKKDIDLVFGSRILRIGSKIDRNNFRHYGGRIIATMISKTLRLPIYDTQCGTKFFRNSELTFYLFQQPFISRWLFDVEIFFRLINWHKNRIKATKSMLEEPLTEWIEKGDSKVKLKDIIKVPLELLAIKSKYK